MNNAPCFNCMDRHTTCHVTCSRYIEWKTERERILDIARKENDIRNTLDASIYASIRKKTKRLTGRPKPRHYD